MTNRKDIERVCMEPYKHAPVPFELKWNFLTRVPEIDVTRSFWFFKNIFLNIIFNPPPPTSTATYFSSTALLLCPSPVLSRHSPRPPFVHYDRSFPALFARALSSLAPNISELVSMVSRSSRMLRLMAKRGGDETATYQGSLRLYEDESSDVALVRQVQGIDLTCCAFNSKVEKLRSKLRKN